MSNSRKKHSGGRTKHPAWDETYEVLILGEKVYRCRYCRKDVGKKIGRVLKHLDKCESKKIQDRNLLDEPEVEIVSTLETKSNDTPVSYLLLMFAQNLQLPPRQKRHAINQQVVLIYWIISAILDNKPPKMRKLDSFVVTTDATTEAKLDSQVAKAFFSY